MKDKGFKALFLVNIVLVLADLASTLVNGKLVEYLEVNPLYKYGGLASITILNFGIYAIFYWLYHRQKDTWTDKQRDIQITNRYMLILILCFLVAMRLTAIQGNLHVAYIEPKEIASEKGISFVEAKEFQLEEAKKVTQAEKTQYINKMMMPYLLPYLAAFIAWVIFCIDHKSEVKE
jgi:predicted membrane protein